jgi:glycosyltransferase involved in cell wall biosynthesis
MNLVLFSPLALTSAIGRATALIVPVLTELGHEVTVIRTEQPPLLAAPPHSCPVRVIPWTDTAAVDKAASKADGLVYQIGNSYDHHCGGLHWLSSLPGIVCLHDFVIAHLFAGWAESRQSQAQYVLGSWYGERVAHAFFSARDHREFIEAASRDHPMTEWLCSMAHGVISHSRWGMPRVAAACAGPVRVVPLAYDAPAARPAAERPQTDDAVQILTVGHANVNKRIESVIQAIGASPVLRPRVRYRLCGRIEPDYALELAQLARSLGVQLTISGETEDIALQAAMNNADIVCCLRWPSLEAASASTIEGLLYGKAVVVIDTGFYSELPDDCVRKISMAHEVTELRLALEDLVAEPVSRHAMAMRGQQWAAATFTAANYAQQILEMIGLVRAAQPIIAMTDTLAGYMQGWGAAPDLLLAEEISAPLRLFEQRAE